MFLTFEQLTDIAKEMDFKIQEPLLATFAADIAIDEQQNKYKEDLIPFRCRAYHDMDNANGSRIDPDVFLDNTRSIKYRPILANVVQNENGEYDFGAHDYHFEEDEEGNEKIIYDEQPIGVITNYGFVEDEVQNVTRAVVNGYLFGTYSENAVNILKKRGRCDCSVELEIRDLHYDIEADKLILDDYMVLGVTILGSKYGPGMVGSEIVVEETNMFKNYQHLNEEEVSRIKNSVRDIFNLPKKTKKEFSTSQISSITEENKTLKEKIKDLEEKLAVYATKELNQAKKEVLSDPVYKPYLSTSEFKELAKDNNLSLDDFKIQAELAFAKYKRKEFSNVSTSSEAAVSKKFTSAKSEENKKSRYGNIFKGGK